MIIKLEKNRHEINVIRKYRDDTKKLTDTDKTMAAVSFDLQEVLSLSKRKRETCTTRGS